MTVENKYVEILGNFGGPFWGREFITKKCVSLEVYQSKFTQNRSYPRSTGSCLESHILGRYIFAMVTWLIKAGHVVEDKGAHIT